MKSTNYEKRSNLWICVVYPESLPENYDVVISNWHIPVALSPMHDKDKNGDDTEKKKHYHLMIDFGAGSNKAQKQVREFTDQLNGTIPIICHNKKAYLRYFIHMDNPEKMQYSREDIRLFGGFELKDAFDSYSTDSMLYQFLETLIYDNMIFNYAVLVKHLRDNNYTEALEFIRRHSNHIKFILDGYWQLLSSNRENLLHNQKK